MSNRDRASPPGQGKRIADTLSSLEPFRPTACLTAMRTAAWASLLLTLAACTGATPSGAPSSASGSSAPTEQPTTSPSEAPPTQELRVGARTHTDGWVVMADGFGVHVAGGGTLQNIDLRRGRSHEVDKIGGWDYDFTTLGRLGEGSLWLASGHELWFIGGSPRYAIGRRYDLHRLGYLGRVYQADPAAGGGTWIGASGDKRRSGLLVEFNPDSGSIIRRFQTRGTPGVIADADGSIIVETEGGVLRINPRTGSERMKHLIVSPGGFAVSGDRIWWTSGGAAVNCMLVETLTACGTVYLRGATVLSSDGRLLWVISGNPAKPATIALLDGTSGDVLAEPIELPHHTPASLTSYDGHAWVGFHDAEAVVRIDRSRIPDSATP